MRKAWLLLGLVKFEHTLFAFPFAVMSAFLAAKGMPSWRTLGYIALAMVGARTAAMGFNRIVDRAYDAANPRTQEREIPSGAVSLREATALVVVSAAAFIFAAYQLNWLALALSPVALLVILGYSYTKRFTSWSHIVLGLCLAIAPVGAWVAVRAEIGWPSLVLALAVVTWVAGFDIIYQCQDVDIDRRLGILSLPASFGIARALWIARGLHIIMLAVLLVLARLTGLGLPYLAGWLMVLMCLVYEHSLVRPSDLRRVNTAFFTLNGVVSLVLMGFTLADVLLEY